MYSSWLFPILKEAFDCPMSVARLTAANVKDAGNVTIFIYFPQKPLATPGKKK